MPRARRTEAGDRGARPAASGRRDAQAAPLAGGAARCRGSSRRPHQPAVAAPDSAPRPPRSSRRRPACAAPPRRRPAPSATRARSARSSSTSPCVLSASSMPLMVIGAALAAPGSRTRPSRRRRSARCRGGPTDRRLRRYRAAWSGSGSAGRSRAAASCRTDSRRFRCGRRSSPPTRRSRRSSAARRRAGRAVRRAAAHSRPASGSSCCRPARRARRRRRRHRRRRRFHV